MLLFRYLFCKTIRIALKGYTNILLENSQEIFTNVAPMARIIIFFFFFSCIKVYGNFGTVLRRAYQLKANGVRNPQILGKLHITDKH